MINLDFSKLSVEELVNVFDHVYGVACLALHMPAIPVLCERREVGHGGAPLPAEISVAPHRYHVNMSHWAVWRLKTEVGIFLQRIGSAPGPWQGLARVRGRPQVARRLEGRRYPPSYFSLVEEA